ncbi:MAG: hypothetical protein COB67_10015, partial [SAR324 cluster bacterium]
EKLVIRAIRKLSALSDFKEGNIAGIENSALLHEHLFFVDDKTDIGLLGQDAGVGHDKTENLDKYVVKAVYKDEERIMKSIAHEVALKRHQEFVGDKGSTKIGKILEKKFTEGIQVDYGLVGGYNCQAYVKEVVDTFNARRAIPNSKITEQIEADEATNKLIQKLERMESHR